jgi:hypothetical protein
MRNSAIRFAIPTASLRPGFHITKAWSEQATASSSLRFRGLYGLAAPCAADPIAQSPIVPADSERPARDVSLCGSKRLTEATSKGYIAISAPSLGARLSHVGIISSTVGRTLSAKRAAVVCARVVDGRERAIVVTPGWSMPSARASVRSDSCAVPPCFIDEAWPSHGQSSCVRHASQHGKRSTRFQIIGHPGACRYDSGQTQYDNGLKTVGNNSGE